MGRQLCFSFGLFVAVLAMCSACTNTASQTSGAKVGATDSSYRHIVELEAKARDGIVSLQWVLSDSGIAPAEFLVERSTRPLTAPAIWQSVTRIWYPPFSEILLASESRYRVAAVAPGGALIGYSNTVSVTVVAAANPVSGVSTDTRELYWLSDFPLISPLTTSAPTLVVSFVARQMALCNVDNGREFFCTSPWMLSDLSEGMHKLRVRLPNGNEAIEGRVMVDRSAPILNVQARAESDPNGSYIVYQILANETLEYIMCSTREHDHFAPCAQNGWLPWDGQTIQLYVEVKDRAGNRASAQAMLEPAAGSVSGSVPPASSSGVLDVRIENLDRAFLLHFVDPGSYNISFGGPGTDVAIKAYTASQLRLAAPQCGQSYELHISDATRSLDKSLQARGGIAGPRPLVQYTLGGVTFALDKNQNLNVVAGDQTNSFVGPGNPHYWWYDDNELEVTVDQVDNGCSAPGNRFVLQPPADIVKERDLRLHGISNIESAELVQDFSGDAVEDLALIVADETNGTTLVWRDGAGGNPFGSEVSGISEVWPVLVPGGNMPTVFALRTQTNTVVFASGGEILSSVILEQETGSFFALGNSEMSFITGNPGLYDGAGQLSWFDIGGQRTGMLIGSDTNTALGQAPLLQIWQGGSTLAYGVSHANQLYWEGYDPVSSNTVFRIALPGASLLRSLPSGDSILFVSKDGGDFFLSLWSPQSGLLRYTLPVGELWTGDVLMAGVLSTWPDAGTSFVVAARAGAVLVPYLLDIHQSRPVPLRAAAGILGKPLSFGGQNSWIQTGATGNSIRMYGLAQPRYTAHSTRLYRQTGGGDFVPDVSRYSVSGEGLITLRFENAREQTFYMMTPGIDYGLPAAQYQPYEQLTAVDSYNRATSTAVTSLLIADTATCSFANAGFGDLLWVEDHTGDGIPELIVADTSWSEGRGRVYLYDAVHCRALRYYDGSLTYGALGERIVQIWDYNGNGYRDLLISHYGDGPTRQGQVDIWDPANGQILKTFTGSAAGDHFGTAMVVLGDKNGDGKNDFAIASGSSDTFGLNAGRIDIISANGGILSTWAGRGDSFWGYALAVVNKPGGENWFVSAWWNDLSLVRLSDYGNPGRGRAVIQAKLAARLGNILTVGDDADGDGVRDLYASGRNWLSDAAGDVYLVSGASGRVLAHRRGRPGELWGQHIELLGDLTGDGVSEIFVGAPGRANGALDLLDGRSLVVLDSLSSPLADTVAWGDSIAVSWDGRQGWLASAETRYINAPFPNVTTTTAGYVTISRLDSVGVQQ